MLQMKCCKTRNYWLQHCHCKKTNIWFSHGHLKLDGEYLSHLWFADDIIIFTRNIAELHEMLQELNQASLEVGLSMSFKKTKIMCNKHAEDTNRKITIDNNEIEEVDHYIYLGQRISMETASKEQEINRRITLPTRTGPARKVWPTPSYHESHRKTNTGSSCWVSGFKSRPNRIAYG